jgi:hypothetical protein
MSNSLEKLMPKKMTEIEVRESALKFCKDMKLPFEVEQRFVDRSIFEHNVRNYTIDDCLAALEGKVLVVEDVKVEEILELGYDQEILCPVCNGRGTNGSKNGKCISCEKCGGHEDRLGYGIILEKYAQAILDMLKKKTEK